MVDLNYTSAKLASMAKRPLADSLSSPDEMSMFQYLDDHHGFIQSPDHTSAAKLEPLDLLDSPDEEDASGIRKSSINPGLRPVKTKLSLEEKKRRNRDCMRRLRSHRNELLVSMRGEIKELETKLNDQLDLSGIPGSALDPVSRRTTGHPEQDQWKRLQVGHTRVKNEIRKLREENYWMQKQIGQRSESLDAIQQIVQERQQACPAIDMDALEEDDIGVWIRNTDHFFPPLQESRGYEIVMDSFRVIQEGIRLMHKFQAPPNAVMGWADQRSVDAQWANFMMRKAFPHENPRELALKTWRMMSDVAEIGILQPKFHEMKVLQRLNEHTLVIARHTYFKTSRVSYCMIYLLFMLETDQGFVVGTRSLDPDEQKMKVFTSEGMTVAKPFHCFHFEKDPSTGGTQLTFAGRVDNIKEGYAKNCAMDMLLAMMRWEGHCVSPLWRLAT